MYRLLMRDMEKKREWDRKRDKRDHNRSYYQRRKEAGLEPRPDRIPKKHNYANATHCARGHELTPENTYDVRSCRECRRLASKVRRDGLTPEERAHRNMTARGRNQDRRARERKMFVEHVDPMVLFERDEGVCGICLEPVDINDFDIDHRIPLDPGEHSYANTQVAHPLCNLRKHRKI